MPGLSGPGCIFKMVSLRRAKLKAMRAGIASANEIYKCKSVKELEEIRDSKKEPGEPGQQNLEGNNNGPSQ